MKQLIFLLTLLLFPMTVLTAKCDPDCDYDNGWTLEVRGAYYQPSSKKLRKVYSQCLLDYQITAAKRVHRFCEVWGEVDWTVKEGSVRKSYDYYGFRDKTKLSLFPMSMGVKLIYPILNCVDIYAGAGVSYSFLKIKNHCKEDYSYYGFSESPFKKEVHKNGLGGLLKVGFQWALSDSTFLDFFADYYIQRFRFSRHEDESDRSVFKHNLDCSGFKCGAGFGVYF